MKKIFSGDISKQGPTLWLAPEIVLSYNEIEEKRFVMVSNALGTLRFYEGTPEYESFRILFMRAKSEDEE